jgi:hypothetical protein
MLVTLRRFLTFPASRAVKSSFIADWWTSVARLLQLGQVSEAAGILRFLQQEREIAMTVSATNYLSR